MSAFASDRTYTVVCLSGNGIGPEVMAEASRALARVSRLHGFRVKETHAPFAGEAFAQSRPRLAAVDATGDARGGGDPRRSST